MTVEQMLLAWGMDTEVWVSAGVHGIWRGTTQSLLLAFLEGPVHVLDFLVEQSQLDRWSIHSPVGVLWVYRNVDLTTVIPNVAN